MNEQDQINQFNADVDFLMSEGMSPPAQRSQEDRSLLAIAALLTETDLSGESQQLAAIRHQLLRSAEYLKTQQSISNRVYLHGGIKMNKTLRIFAMSAAALTIVAVAFLTVPPLRAFAQQIIEFFMTTDTDTSTTEIHVGGTPSNPDEDYYPLSIEALVEQVKFALLVPTFIPKAYHFDGGIYFPGYQSASLHYVCQEPWAIDISQASANQEDLENLYKTEVGASANIEQVTIGTALGQYVRGSWIIEADPDLMKQAQEQGSAVTDTAKRVWTNDSEWQRLDWYADGILYSVMTSGGIIGGENEYPTCSLDKDDFVAIAQGLQAANRQ